MKQLKLQALVAIFAAMGLVIGCDDWDTGNSADLGQNIGVNVSGFYQATLPGIPIVAQSESVPPAFKSEDIGTGDGINAVFESYLEIPVVQGSVTVTAVDTNGNTMVLTDAGSAASEDGAAYGTLVPMNTGHASEGVMDYFSGAISLEWAEPPAAGTDVTVQYAQTQTGAASTLAVSSFTVFHTEGSLEIVDNNGDVFTGFITKATVSAAPSLTQQEEESLVTKAEESTASASAGSGASGRGSGSDRDIIEKEFGVSYPFEASGRSGDVDVTLTGFFRVTVVVSYWLQQSTAEAGNWSGFTYELSEVYRAKALSMQGTWIESNGISAEINASGPSDIQNELIEYDIL